MIKFELHFWKFVKLKKITKKLLQCSELVFGLKYESGPPEKNAVVPTLERDVL